MSVNIVVLSGGLGNQMFQYAFSEYIKKVTFKRIIYNDYMLQRESVHNGFELENVFNIKIEKSKPVSFLIRFLRKLFIFQTKFLYKKMLCRVLNNDLIRIIKEKECDYYHYKEKYISQIEKGEITVIWGYWQNEGYFKGINLFETFRFNKSKLSDKSINILKYISLCNSVSIHVRRGDYLLAENKKSVSDICTLDYYQSAMLYIKEKFDQVCFFCFSDDIDWVKENLQEDNLVFIDWNKGNNSWQDMCLMSNCKHNIIANSTFSWWGAFLNQNSEKIVISPTKFSNVFETKDFIPVKWMKLDREGKLQSE